MHKYYKNNARAEPIRKVTCMCWVECCCGHIGKPIFGTQHSTSESIFIYDNIENDLKHLELTNLAVEANEKLKKKYPKY